MGTSRAADEEGATTWIVDLKRRLLIRLVESRQLDEAAAVRRSAEVATDKNRSIVT